MLLGLNLNKHSWKVLCAGVPTGQIFSNPALAAATARELPLFGGGIEHPLFGRFDYAGCKQWLRKTTLLVTPE